MLSRLLTYTGNQILIELENELQTGYLIQKIIKLETTTSSINSYAQEEKY